jgi:(2Fe-2S) ferredoxin
MVLVLPEQIWYNQVQPQDVPRIVRQHLGLGEPVKDKLYRRFHPDRVKPAPASLLWIWVVVGLGLLSMVGLLVVGIGWAW